MSKEVPVIAYVITIITQTKAQLAMLPRIPDTGIPCHVTRIFRTGDFSMTENVLGVTKR